MPIKTKTEDEISKSPTLTPEERAIVQRTLHQDTDWHTITEDELTDYSLSEDPYKLPPRAQKMQDEKQYAFRWCERTPERIDALTRTAPVYKRWTLATRTTLKELEDEVDSILGCITRGDQALLFRPWAFHERERRMKEQLAQASYESGSLEGRKRAIEDRDHDVRAVTGNQAAITSKDEVFYQEGGLSDADLGDLVDN